MLTFSKEERALANLNDMPGFTGEIILSDIHAKDMTCVAKNLSGSYVPQNSITNGRLTIKVAGVEATSIEIALKKVEESTEAFDENGLSRTIKSPLHLADIISHSGTLAPLHSEQQVKIITAMDDILLTESGVSTTEHHSVKGGKITSKKMVITYQEEQQSTLTQQTFNLFNAQILADKNLSASIFQTFNDKMFAKYPLMRSEKPCKTLSHATPNKLCDVILSRTYSSNPAATQKQFQDALKTYARYSFTHDVIKMLALYIAVGDDSPATPFDLHYTLDGVTYFVSRKEPLRIVHCQTQDESKANQSANIDSQVLSEIGGHYSPEFNVVTFEGNEGDDDSFSPYFIHEASHALMNFIFKNKTKPYCQNDANQKKAYEQATLSVYKNVAKKLGIKKEVLSAIKCVADIILLLKRETILDLIEYRSRPTKSDDTYFIAELRAKYGFGEEVSEKLNDTIIRKLDIEIADRKLKAADLAVLSEFAVLLYDYKEEDIEEELIVRLPQLLAEEVPSTKLKSYLNPLMKYWNATVTPAVSTLFEIHQARCRQIDPKTTSYLIEEYLPSASNRKRKRISEQH